jgi:hypothetical protein
LRFSSEARHRVAKTSGLTKSGQSNVDFIPPCGIIPRRIGDGGTPLPVELTKGKSMLDMKQILGELKTERPIFHSEADFQFALAWKIHKKHGEAQIRLEYPIQQAAKSKKVEYLDLLVTLGKECFPIELKYKTKAKNKKEPLSVCVRGEQFHLKGHGAQICGAYDFMKDICRVESFISSLAGCMCGYTLWLTNDLYYLHAPRDTNAGYAAFSVHQGAIKEKSVPMNWGANISAKTKKGRKAVLTLHNDYTIKWEPYSNLNACSDSHVEHGEFMYALTCIEGEASTS